MRNERHPTAAPDATRVHKHQLGAYSHDGQSHHAYIGGPRGVLADSRAPFLRIRNAGQSEGASHSARVSKHQADVCGYGGRIYRANLGGHGVKISPIGGPDLRMRNARQSGAALRSAHVATHQTSITLDSYRVKTGNLRGVVVTSRFRGPIWRKT
jgi:hypothetical protein